MKSFTCSIISALEFACITAKPPTISFASVKGPSVTVNWPLESRSLAPRALGRHPSVAITTPDFSIFSTYLPISSISFWVGGTPSGLFDL